MGKLNRDFLSIIDINSRREILDWRDDKLTYIDTHLNSHFTTLINKMESYVTSYGLTNTFINKNKILDELDIIYRVWVSHTYKHFIESAGQQIMAIADKRQKCINKYTVKEHFSLKSGSTSSLYAGAAIASVPIVINAATVSVGGFLGAVGVTAVSWPIALVGATVIAALSVKGWKANKQKKINDILENVRQVYKDEILLLCHKISNNVQSKDNYLDNDFSIFISK